MISRSYFCVWIVECEYLYDIVCSCEHSEVLVVVIEQFCASAMIDDALICVHDSFYCKN